MGKGSGTTKATTGKTASASHTVTSTSGKAKLFGPGSYRGMKVSLDDIGGKLREPTKDALSKAKEYNDIMYVMSKGRDIEVLSPDAGGIKPHDVLVTVYPKGTIKQGYQKRPKSR